ncbi:sigma factor [Kerstersia gyiorum]|uniref:sigma factor n=1 Tax=Kerstersia gyiorum TaxID=206506 RepID=UPI0039F66646
MAGDIAQRDQIVHGLYREHHAWLVSLLRRRLGDNHQAADLAQDVFERLLRVDLRTCWNLAPISAPSRRGWSLPISAAVRWSRPGRKSWPASLNPAAIRWKHSI